MPKNIFWGKLANWTQFGPNLCYLIYLSYDWLWEFVWNVVRWLALLDRDKWLYSIFPEYFLLGQMSNLGQNLFRFLQLLVLWSTLKFVFAIFIFSPNDSLSKTIKIIFSRLSRKLSSFSRYLNFCIFLLSFFLLCQPLL